MSAIGPYHRVQNDSGLPRSQGAGARPYDGFGRRPHTWEIIQFLTWVGGLHPTQARNQRRQRATMAWDWAGQPLRRSWDRSNSLAKKGNRFGSVP